jgi:hypothetical protein
MVFISAASAPPRDQTKVVYHRDKHAARQKWWVQISEQEAIRRGNRPCKVCVHP